MNLDEALMVSDTRLMEVLRADALRRVQDALVGAVMAQETPALLKSLKVERKKAEEDVATLEEELTKATDAAAAQRPVVADLNATLKAIRDEYGQRREHRALPSAQAVSPYRCLLWPGAGDAAGERLRSQAAVQ